MTPTAFSTVLFCFQSLSNLSGFSLILYNLSGFFLFLPEGFFPIFSGGFLFHPDSGSSLLPDIFLLQKDIIYEMIFSMFPLSPKIPSEQILLSLLPFADFHWVYPHWHLIFPVIPERYPHVPHPYCWYWDEDVPMIHIQDREFPVSDLLPGFLPVHWGIPVGGAHIFLFLSGTFPVHLYKLFLLHFPVLSILPAGLSDSVIHLPVLLLLLHFRLLFSSSESWIRCLTVLLFSVSSLSPAVQKPVTVLLLFFVLLQHFCWLFFHYLLLSVVLSAFQKFPVLSVLSVEYCWSFPAADPAIFWILSLLQRLLRMLPEDLEVLFLSVPNLLSDSENFSPHLWNLPHNFLFLSIFLFVYLVSLQLPDSLFLPAGFLLSANCKTLSVLPKTRRSLLSDHP